jgi:hypothetical protein
MATKAQLLAAFSTSPVPFEIGGQSFHLRPLLVGDMLAVNEYQKARPDGSTAPMIFVRAVCDADSVRLFDDADAAMVDAGVVGGVVDAVVSRVLDISRLGESPSGKARSTSGPSSNSSSASPGT